MTGDVIHAGPIEIGGVVNAGGPPNVERIGEVMQRHGLRPAPPARS